MAKDKNKEKSLLPKEVAKKDVAFHYLKTKDADLLGIKDNSSPYLVLKCFKADYECFSKWNQNELKAFSKFNEELMECSWEQIFKMGGKSGSKTGLGYTKLKNKSKLPNQQFVKELSPDIDFFELRVTQKARVHGFRIKSAFFLVWLDKDHRMSKKLNRSK